MLLRIAAVDDDANDADALLACLSRFTEQNHTDLRTDRFLSADELLEGYLPLFDVIFLDIEMPGTDGMAAARAIRRVDDRSIIVFVTNMAQLAIEGYGVDALDFLVKPVDYYSVEMVMRKALRRLRSQKGESVTVVTRSGVRVVPFSQLNYIEVRDHYVTYHTIDEDLTVRGTLGEVERQLSGGNFRRCNRWFLVNVEKISRLEGNKLWVGDDVLEVSRSNKKEILRAVAGAAGGAL